MYSTWNVVPAGTSAAASPVTVFCTAKLAPPVQSNGPGPIHG
nr:hypothetical protein [Cellulosimicrobium sp. MM]